MRESIENQKRESERERNSFIKQQQEELERLERKQFYTDQINEMNRRKEIETIQADIEYRIKNQHIQEENREYARTSELRINETHLKSARKNLIRGWKFSSLQAELLFNLHINFLYKLEERSQRGDIRAQNQLGEKLLIGDELEKNEILARYWLKQAASQGNAPAASMLKILDIEAIKVSFANLTYIPDFPKEISKKGFTSEEVCSYHNGAMHEHTVYNLSKKDNEPQIAYVTQEIIPAGPQAGKQQTFVDFYSTQEPISKTECTLFVKNVAGEDFKFFKSGHVQK